MDARGLILLIPDKPDDDRDSVATAWRAYGGEVLRLGRFWEPPPVDASRVRVYGSDSFCLVLQQKLGFDLCSPDDRLLASLPDKYLKRHVMRQQLCDGPRLSYPKFVKTVVPKLIPSRVYSDAAELADA